MMTVTHELNQFRIKAMPNNGSQNIYYEKSNPAQFTHNDYD